jgi:hypothetical protein
MGILDSKSSANTTSQNVGLSEIGGAATSVNVQGGGKNSTTNVQLTDAGAVQGALAYARESTLAVLDYARQSQDTVLGASKESTAAAYGLANQARQSETSGAINNALKYGAILVGLAIAAFALRRG